MVEPLRTAPGVGGLAAPGNSVSYGWTLYGWALWRLPNRVMLLVLGVQAAAVGLVVAGLAVAGPGPAEDPRIGLAALLVGLSVVHTELATGIERARRRATETSYFDLSSVWTFAAALLLPPTTTAVVVLAVYLHLWQRVWRPAGIPLHRHAYTTATVLLAAGAAHAVIAPVGLPSTADDLPAVVAVAAAVLAYVVVNQLLVAWVLGLTRDRAGWRELAGRWDDNAVELATICMGALTAVALATTPGLVVLVLPPVLVLHRAVLVRQLEKAVHTDAKTNLLTATAWRARAEQAMARPRRGPAGIGVLIMDLDHFKVVNDEHGHLAGDGVLAAVAAELRAGVRQHDLVGRFGGEEFVVLLPDLPAGASGRVELCRVAERLRGRIADLAVTVPVSAPTGDAAVGGVRTITGLSVSVGGATVPIDGTDLDAVLRAADSSLYAAKRGGRNLVRIAGTASLPVPRRPLL